RRGQPCLVDPDHFGGAGSLSMVWAHSVKMRPTMRHYAKLSRATLTASLMLVAIAGAAVAGPLEDGEAAYQRGDFATALGLLRPLAGQGNADAQYDLGAMYRDGKGVPQDYAEAVKWWRKAADQGNAHAQGGLGGFY